MNPRPPHKKRVSLRLDPALYARARATGKPLTGLIESALRELFDRQSSDAEQA